VAVGADFDFGLSVNFFTFVPVRNFCDPHPHNFRVASAQVTQIYNHTTIINNFNINSHDRRVINNGIPPERISAVTHTEIRRVNIRESSAPVPRGEQVGRDTIIVNRPHFADRPNPAAPALHNPSQPQNKKFSQPEHNQPAPQIQPSQSGQTENPQRNPRSPQDHGADSAPNVQHPTPAPGSPFQAQPADLNSHPPVQSGQTGAPRNFTRNPDAQKNVVVTPQAPVVPPAANHFTPQPAQTTRPAQHNFTPRQNDATPGDTRPSRAEPPAIAVQPPQRNFTPRQNDLPSADTRQNLAEPQPQSPSAQAPAAAASPQPSQRNPGRQDKNQNGLQQ
jgi:hypothetical protein